MPRIALKRPVFDPFLNGIQRYCKEIAVRAVFSSYWFENCLLGEIKYPVIIDYNTKRLTEVLKESVLNILDYKKQGR
ncbi:hypothetical protein BB021_08305 [Elizabethkingia ursingii]|uniref:Uncharacterized protein n=1 Tax=Elizabethkingia ursingii TaxID=1756150 RepID=A0ABX3N8N4_9FLAO|nr:hypothetical protein BB021_08305 [Elizabethkingia ursingii]